MMMPNPEQADKKYKHSCMPCRFFVQPPLDVDRIDSRIDAQMLKQPQNMLDHLSALDYGRNPDIGTLNK